LFGLAMAAAFLCSVGVRADVQLPMRHGALHDDERAPIIDRLIQPRISGERLLGRVEQQSLELDAKLELWLRSVRNAWIADAVDGYADLPPAGAAREDQFRSLWFFARDHWDLRSVPQLDTIFPLDDIHRMVDARYMLSARLPLPEQDAELIFIVLTHSMYCGSAGCQSPILLKRGGTYKIVGDYQPGYARNGHACAIVLESRTNGVNDLLELADPEGFFLHRWDGRGYDREQLTSKPSTTCCAGDIDPAAPTQCPPR